jgi:hypothetical protein
MYVCTYVRMYVCTYVRMYVCTYVRMYVCTYVRMYVCTYVRMSVPLRPYGPHQCSADEQDESIVNRIDGLETH